MYARENEKIVSEYGYIIRLHCTHVNERKTT